MTHYQPATYTPLRAVTCAPSMALQPEYAEAYKKRKNRLHHNRFGRLEKRNKILLKITFNTLEVSQENSIILVVISNTLEQEAVETS
jgi:hypothetical protein